MMSLRDALKSLTVGLYRRGSSENGNSSIISKEILGKDGEEHESDYPFEIDQPRGIVWGTVPFYAPRTPGHVLFRLYWKDEPVYTLGAGPTLNVTVNEPNIEPTLRFILSNFKSKKGNPTSLSSLGALSLVLEQFRPNNSSHNSRHMTHQRFDGAGRAAWGCICESRKVLEACASEYRKTREKLKKLEEEVVMLQETVGAEKNTAEEGTEPDGEDSTALKLKEKTGALRGGRAANERKWKDSQVAFSTILHVSLGDAGRKEV